MASLPVSLSFKPFPYQRDMVAHLLSVPRGGLFVGAGLGKTACVLEAFSSLRALGLAKRMLVVAPLRVANLTWPNEVAKWADYRHLKVVSLRDKAGLAAWESGKADIYTCNFESLQKLGDGIFKKRFPVDVICVDELSKAKSPSSKRIRALSKHVDKAAFVWGLTGTPSPNSYRDLMAQCRLIDRGETFGHPFGHTIESFTEKYFWSSVGFDNSRKYELKAGALDDITRRLSERYLSLPRESYLDIPNVSVEDVEVSLKCIAEYRRLEKDFVMEMADKKQIEVVSTIAKIGKLRQATVGIMYDADGQEHFTGCLEKLKALKGIIAAESGPVLVAVHFRHEMNFLRDSLPGAVLFQGGSAREQQRILHAWNAGKIPVLIANPQSMSHGLNMQDGGSVLVWHSMSYSSEQYEQMNARLARTGQTNPTRIYRLVATGTIDEAIAEVLREKLGGQEALIKTVHILNKK